MDFTFSNKINKHCFGVFLFLWLMTGLTIDERDQINFTLQQMGVDSIVTYGTMVLGHSDLQILTPGRDTFLGKRGTMAAKQPGQFVTAAIPYFVLSAFGLTYENDYLLTASLVSWFSASLVSAIALTMLYLLIIEWGYRRDHAIWAVFSIGLFSHWYVYAGIAHHDIIAASYLLMGLYFSEKSLLHGDGEKWWFSVLGGLFAGLTLFTSMLPALIVYAFGLYVFISMRPRHIVYTGIGFLIGLLPLVLYNYYYFGNPFTQANVAGNYTDTFFNLDYDQFIHNMNAYIGWGGISIWKYSPIVGLGIFGIFLLPGELLRIKVLVFSAVVLHLFYLFNIESKGTCMYGPRYLIPLLPLVGLGVAMLLNAVRKRFQFQMGVIFVILAGYSFLVSFVGSMGSAMQCDLYNFAFIEYLADHNRTNLDNLPLFFPMLASLVMFVMYLIWLNREKYFSTKLLS